MNEADLVAEQLGYNAPTEAPLASTPLTDEELLSYVQTLEKVTLGPGYDELNRQRATCLDFYNQLPYGNEQEGRSQVVTSEVFDTVERALPQLLTVFTSSKTAVEFTPERPEDVPVAEQMTDVANYVFYRQNNGFMTLYTMFKDALLMKNGYVHVRYEVGKRKKRQQYRGLTGNELQLLIRDRQAEILEQHSYDDPLATPGMEKLANDRGRAVMTMIQQGVPPEVADQQLPPLPPWPQIHDVRIEFSEDYGQVKCDNLPPEQVYVDRDHNSVSLKDAKFVAVRARKYLSDLAAAGYDVSDLPGGSDDDLITTSPEYLARRADIQDPGTLSSLDAGNEPNDASREVWVTTAWVRVDADGDGELELMRVVYCQDKLFEREEVSLIPVAVCTPIIMTHRHHGKSLAELVADLQLLKSMMTRTVADNAYLAVSPQKVVPMAADGTVLADLDELLNGRVGGVVRYQQGSNPPAPLTTPFMGDAGIGMLRFFDDMMQHRTGLTDIQAGLDPDVLNPTATGQRLALAQANQRLELIARTFAETGVSEIFQLIVHCLIEYGVGRPLALRLRDEWVTVDPSTWERPFDTTINVGLGTGNKDQNLVHLAAIAQAQQAIIASGGMGLLVNPKHLYNTQKEIVKNTGLQDPELYFKDPGNVELPPPGMTQKKVDPQQELLDLEKAKSKALLAQREAELALKKRESDQEYAIKERLATLELTLAKEKAELDAKSQEMKLMFQKLEQEQKLLADAAKAAQDIRLTENKAAFVGVPNIHGSITALAELLATSQRQLQEMVKQVGDLASADRESILEVDADGNPSKATSRIVMKPTVASDQTLNVDTGM